MVHLATKAWAESHIGVTAGRGSDGHASAVRPIFGNQVCMSVKFSAGWAKARCRWCEVACSGETERGTVLPFHTCA
jgi:hypothetical protein